MRELSHSALAILLLACESGEAPLLLPDPEILKPSKPRPTVPTPMVDELFDPDRVLEVDVFVTEEDWERIRKQRFDDDFLTQPDCQDRPFPEFTFSRGTVVIDRRIVEDVGVRQRGSFYQLNEHIPPLEISFDTYVPNRRFSDRRQLHLESATADPTAMRACLAYRVFENAGVPVPRCTFAHVRVNGNDLGIYAHVEAVDDDFVRRRFPEVEGALFEGKASDFRDGWMATFDGPFDRSAIRAVRDALAATDDQLIQRVEAVVDLEQFYRFWAVETVIGHFDGYAGNADRFYVFVHPERGMQFIPSATETSFSPYNPFLRGEQPPSVYAQGELARRLYLNAAGQRAYLDALDVVLRNAWNEEELHAEIDRVEALIGGRIGYRAIDLKTNLETLRLFVDGRRDAVEQDIGAEWNIQRRPTFCIVPRGSASVVLTTTWDSLPPAGAIQEIFNSGTATVSASFDGIDYLQVRAGGAAAGPTPEGQAILVSIAETGFGSALAVYIVMDPSEVAPGTFQLDPQTTIAGSIAWYDGADSLPVWTGYLFGTLELRRASTAPGAPIEAAISADLY